MSNIFVNTIVKEGTPYVTQGEFLDALAELKLPISGIEVRWEYFSETAPERSKEFSQVVKVSRENGWEIRCSIPVSLFLPEGLNPALSEYLAAIKELEAISVKFNTGNIEGMSKVSAADLKAMLPADLTVTIENDQSEENGKLPAVEQALALIEQRQLPIGYTFDVGNWQVMQEDAEQAFAELKEKITIVHLKTVVQGKTVLLDDSQIPWRNFLSAKWPIGIEYPLSLTELKDEFDKVQAVLNQN